MKTINISEANYEWLVAYAESGGLDIDTASEKVMNTARSRLESLAKYAEATKGKRPTPRNPNRAEEGEVEEKPKRKRAKKAAAAPKKKPAKKAAKRTPKKKAGAKKRVAKKAKA